jgi:predicted nucleic-acid-binding Zn-ribbon protein
MDKRIKCTNCGSKDFIEYAQTIDGQHFQLGLQKQLLMNTLGRDEDCFEENILSIYACLKCGHLEFFVSEKKIQNHVLREKKQAEARADAEYRVKQQEQKETALRKQIDDLEKIVDDEDQTVKAVNEAKENIRKLKRELEELYRSDPRNRGLIS